MIRLGWIMGIVAMAALPFLDGNEVLKVACAFSVATSIAVSMWLSASFKDASTYSVVRLTVLALVAVVTANIGVLYVGALSAAPMVVVVGLFSFCRTESFRSALAIYLAAALLHGIPALLMALGLTADPGFYLLDTVTPLQHVVGLAFVQGLYLGVFAISRMTRKASKTSIDEVQEATRLASQREALLHELRNDLDRALQVGGPGRYTDKILGPYKLGVVIGRGAMGEVYDAFHVDTDDNVAVKFLHANLLADPKHVTRFLREARAAGSLTSPHVVRVLDASDPFDPIPWLAMERIHGDTLGQLLSKERNLSLREVAELIDQLAEVLDETRQHGIVHRDIKPANVLLAKESKTQKLWKLLDFGIATLGETTGTLTQGGVIGTPAYMAPEQARGEKVDYRADLYALVAVAYRCVLRRPPFRGKDIGPVLYQVVHDMPVLPSAIGDFRSDSVGKSMDEFFAIGLAKARDDRFVTAADLAGTFRRALKGSLPADLKSRAKRLQRDHPFNDPSERARRLRQALAS